MRSTMLKAVIVLAPAYVAAYLTGEMVWVVPTLVGSGFFAAFIGPRQVQITRVDEDADDGDDDD